MATEMADTVRARTTTWADRAQFAGLASVGAGAIHLAAAGIHAEHPTLARIFVVLGALQVVGGLVLALGGGRPAAAAVAVVNAVAVGGWVLTRTTGVSWVDGLEQAEHPQFADTVCAALGAIAVALAVAVIIRGARWAPRLGLVVPGALVGVISLAAMLTATTHVHTHEATAAGHVHDEPAAAAGAVTGHVHDEAAGTPAAPAAQAPVAAAWPRPWDPAQPIDFSGVAGVTREQQDRAESLVAATLADLPQFSDITKVGALGFRSIGDSRSGFEHFINFGYIRDDSFLDPNRPESLVYQVDGDKRTLVSAMFIAKDMTITDPQLVDWGGPLMTWHVHEDLCWGLDANHQPIVVGVKDAAGKCPPGSINAGGTNPMVHVWIGPNECGPFAALEGHGAGQVAGDAPRTDQCVHHHDPGG